MTDRDQQLQDAFDRHLRGDAPPPDTTDPEAAAYQQVYAVLGEPPDGDLPDDFAEGVADRVGIGTAPTTSWVEIVLLFLAVAGLGTGLVMLPSLTGTLYESLYTTLRAFNQLSSTLRLDIVGAAGLVLLLTLVADALWTHEPPLRRAPTAT
mgnify:CR=1 FL=1